MLKVGLSKRRHLPAFKVQNVSYPLWDYETAKYHASTGLSLDALALKVLQTETELYHPHLNLEGKTVLDIGATCGEISYYYLKQHKAKHCIAVECDQKRLPHLRANALKYSIMVVPHPFSKQHLRILNYDFIKCDVEGYEMLLYEYAKEGGTLKPCILEAHTNYIKDKLMQVGFKAFHTKADELSGISIHMMRNYEALQ